ncbi:MAG: glycosyltransferase [Desulfobacterales bacterium]|nr:glycosyltransferase [Desulfobacterales bacterium]
MKNGIQKVKPLFNGPVCSICIANYNGIGVIEECLRSVMEQDCNFPFEIIVHDDASSDRSVEVLKRSFPNVILIASEENVGFCVSNNRMVAASRGKYILILNNDAVLFSNALGTFYEYAESEKQPCIYGIRQFDAATGELIDFGIFLDPFLNSIPNQDLSRSDVSMVLGACLWVPRRIWQETGGFPDWFTTMHEDMYICCLARLYGHPVRVIMKSGYRHWVGKSLGGGKIVANRLATTLKRRALSERNRLYVMALCYPAPVLFIILPLHILVLLLEGIFISLCKNDTKILRNIYVYSFKSLLINRNKILKTRHKIFQKDYISSRNFTSLIHFVPYKLRMLIRHGIPEVT